MMIAIVLALALGGNPGAGFEKNKNELTKQAIKKGVETKKVSMFAATIAVNAETLAEKFTEATKLKTTVKNVLVSNKAEGQELDMAVVVFTNSEGTFALVFVSKEEGVVQVLPRDFTAL